MSNTGSLRDFLSWQARTDLLLGAQAWPILVASDKSKLAEVLRRGFRKPQPSPKMCLPRHAKEKEVRLRALDEGKVKKCTLCPLCQHRTQTVFGQGDPNARLVFVGEGPGYEEDRQGLAFVGPAGQLLTKMILAMGLKREEVYICNVVKCRPPGNRTPLAEEILACLPYLQEQLAIIEPEMIVALGAPAAKTLLNTAEPIGKLRGRFHEYYLGGQYGVGSAIPVMPTYHPAYLLRNPADKRLAWEDLQRVMARLGLTGPRSA